MWKTKLCMSTSGAYGISIEEQIKLFKKIGFDGILTFELKTKSQDGRYENDKYAEMPVERYIAAAYERACRVATLKERNK